MKFHLIIATILITFISCDKEVYNNIPEEELPIWQTNDTLCFINNEGLADTFLIKITDEYTVSDKRYYYQVISIFYNKLSNSTTSPVKKMNSKHKLATNFQVNSYYYPTLYSNTEPEKNIEINGVKYHNVYH